MVKPAGSEARVVVQLRLKPGSAQEYLSAAAKLSGTLADDPHFLEVENHLDRAWAEPAMVWHFSDVASARAWTAHPSLRAFIDSLSSCSIEPPLVNVILDAGSDPSGKASIVVSTKVKKGYDGWFGEWQGRMGAAQQQFPGYVGQRLQAPILGVNPSWVSVVAFDSPETLRGWTSSQVRMDLLRESEPYVERFDVRPASSAFESWFASSDRGSAPPPAWKLSAIVLLVLYPIVMLEFFTVNHLTQDDWHLKPALAVFVGNAISVAVTGFLLIPWASRLLNWWLVPPAAKARAQLAGWDPAPGPVCRERARLHRSHLCLSLAHAVIAALNL